jgi:L-rhamnose mutarotase
LRFFKVFFRICVMKYLFAMIIFIVSAQAESVLKEYYPSRTKTVLDQALEKNSRQILCGRIKIKEGMLDEVRQWFQTLNERKVELLEAFAAEGVELESVFLDAERSFLIYYMRQEDLAKVYETLAKLQLPVRLFHVECWKKYCDECIVLEPLFDLKR